MIVTGKITYRLAVNPFVPNAPFLYPLKTSENRKFFWCFNRKVFCFFSGVKKGVLGTNGLTVSCEPINYFVLLESKHKKVSTLIKQ